MAAKNTAAQRLQKELMDLMSSAVEGISAFPDNDNLFHWIGTIQGAPNTAYDGLEFELSLKFSANYPFEPPVVTFNTPCFHPNVDTHGGICLDILKENWSAVYTASQVLLCIQSLLDNPNNASPLNPQAATLW
jgi:ubiquitin-conjugating enzyme E2 C